MSANNKISHLVNSQVPFFVRNDHRTFVAFLEAYYEYLEQAEAELSEGKVGERAQTLLQNMDVDQSIDGFANKFYDNFLSILPKAMSADKNILIKNIQDFYRARGTEKALKFLMRILTDGLEAQLYYPKVDVLRASDGKWYIQKSLRVEDARIDGMLANNSIDNIASKRITGNTSNSTAIVERIDTFIENGSYVEELVISGDRGNFLNGETIHGIYEENGLIKHFTANVFGGIINSVTIQNGGSGYSVNDPVIVEGEGTGADIKVSQVSAGNLTSFYVVEGGAGFKANDTFLVTGGGGSGANGKVLSVDTSNFYHQNTFNVYTSVINDEANTLLSAAVYANLNNLITTANANATLANALVTFSYGPCGPITDVVMLNPGSGYSSVPTVDVIANTTIKNMGVLGRMEIINGGVGYAVGDTIEFVGGTGYGANAVVANIAGNGMITRVAFTNMTSMGVHIGGFGYSQALLPTTNVRTSTGSGANVAVKSILGDGEIVRVTTDALGEIIELTIYNRGSGYANVPTLNLQASGDGTAQATATIVTGVYTYPGRYLNDDGHISSYNFLQDRDYYQNYSYVVKVKKSLSEYADVLFKVLHPAGMKMFGEYLLNESDNPQSLNIEHEQSKQVIYKLGTYYVSNVGNVRITYTSHGIAVNNEVYLETISGNLTNGIFTTSLVANTNVFYVSHSSNIAVGNTGTVMFGKLV